MTIHTDIEVEILTRIFFHNQMTRSSHVAYGIILYDCNAFREIMSTVKDKETFQGHLRTWILMN